MADLPISKPHDKKDEAYKLIADEDLSWEDFLEATPRIVTSMRDNDWADDRIQMFIDFWTAIHRHPWRHALDCFSQQALRAYQAQQRKKWHLAAGTSHSWSLVKINQDVLQETRDVIIANAHQRELTALNEVCFYEQPFLLLPTELWLTLPFFLPRSCVSKPSPVLIYPLFHPALAAIMQISLNNPLLTIMSIWQSCPPSADQELIPSHGTQCLPLWCFIYPFQGH